MFDNFLAPENRLHACAWKWRRGRSRGATAGVGEAGRAGRAGRVGRVGRVGSGGSGRAGRAGRAGSGRVGSGGSGWAGRGGRVGRVGSCGAKRSFSILEDNDRAGYKSRKAITAKEEVRIVPIDYPTYSPDLNVLDYFLWSEVERRMAKSRVTKIETAEEYKKRLRRTAMAIPRAVIQRAIRGMKKRAAAVVKAAGNSISMD